MQVLVRCCFCIVLFSYCDFFSVVFFIALFSCCDVLHCVVIMFSELFQGKQLHSPRTTSSIWTAKADIHYVQINDIGVALMMMMMMTTTMTTTTTMMLIIIIIIIKTIVTGVNELFNIDEHLIK